MVNTIFMSLYLRYDEGLLALKTRHLPPRLTVRQLHPGTVSNGR
jgi:hypothetical protein